MAPIPSNGQIQRLKNLQGTDAGVFTLAVFSVIEAFLRHKLGFAVDYKTTFYQLLQTYREKFGRGDHIELLYVFIPQNCNSQPVDDLRKILKEH